MKKQPVSSLALGPNTFHRGVYELASDLPPPHLHHVPVTFGFIYFSLLFSESSGFLGSRLSSSLCSGTASGLNQSVIFFSLTLEVKGGGVISQLTVLGIRSEAKISPWVRVCQRLRVTLAILSAPFF